MFNSDPPSNIHLNAWQQWALQIEKRMQDQEDTIKQLQAELEHLKQRNEKEAPAPLPTIHVDKIEYRFDQLKVETLEGSLQIGLSTSNPEQLPLMIEDIMMQQQVNQSGSNQNTGNTPFPYPATNSAIKPNSNSSNSKLNYLQEKFTSLRSRENEQQHVERPDQHNQSENLQQHLKKQNLDHSNRPVHSPLNSSDLAKQQIVEKCLQQLRDDLKDKFKNYIHRQSTLLQTDIADEHTTLIIEDIDRQLPSRVHYYVYEQHARKYSDIEKLGEQVLKLTREDIESAIDQYIYQLTSQPKEGQD